MDHRLDRNPEISHAATHLRADHHYGEIGYTTAQIIALRSRERHRSRPTLRAKATYTCHIKKA
ncbi:MAG: hypothetical protein IPO26_19975 [Saprospiraceae bacterium]|nr:hypothetical protein [Saprospiraceae bacterium]